MTVSLSRLAEVAAARRRPLDGRAAIVTGSTSGIGLGIATELASQGAAVLLNGFGERGEIESIARTLSRENDVDVDYDGTDMSKPEMIEAMVAHATERFGQVDILVNNAGIQYVSPIEDFPPARWDAIIAINLSSTFHTSRVSPLPA